MYQNIKKLYSYLDRGQQQKLILLQFLVILMSLAEVAGILSIGPFMGLIGDLDQIYEDNILADLFAFSGLESPTRFLVLVAISVMLVLTIAALVNIYTIWKISMYAAQVGADLSNRLFIYYIHQPWLFHASSNSSELVNKIVQECSRLSTLVINPLMHLNARLIMATCMLIAVTIYNPLVSVVASLMFGCSYYLLFILARNKLKRNGDIISIKQEERFKLMSEGFGGIKDTLMLGKQENFTARFLKASDLMAYSTGNTNTLTLFPKYLLELLAYSGVIGLVLYLIFTNNGDLAQILPTLAIFALAGFKLLPAFQLCYSSISVIRSNISSFEMLEEDLYKSSESMNLYKALDEQGALAKWDIQKSIEVKNISFSYPSTSLETLQNISINIQAGSLVGIVGSSGSGKSTLIDIILGLIQPKSGEIIVDGITVNASNLRKWQNSIGVVSQNIFLTDSSIKENVAFGVPCDDIQEERVEEALRLANIDSFISSLPEGFNTRVGERGVQLSGGQRQRIGIARALYNKANILVFDEATSSLDGITEKKVMDAVHTLAATKTIIIVAHRLASVRKCDVIYLLNEGKQIDSGTYDTLSSENAMFKKMTELS